MWWDSLLEYWKDIEILKETAYQWEIRLGLAKALGCRSELAKWSVDNQEDGHGERRPDATAPRQEGPTVRISGNEIQPWFLV